VHAFVIASRFGMLLGLALWLGLGVSLLLAFPVIEKQLPPPEARQLAAALGLRFDKALFLALALVLVSMGARFSIDRVAPPSGLAAPVAVMTLCRLLLALAVSPALRALIARHRDPAAPASRDEQTALSRLLGARGLLLSLEVCMCLYALLAVS
jgi:Domain of unknown function (DUF4149)